MAAFTTHVIAEAVVFTWLFMHTEGSVLIATLFHGCSNAAMLFHAGISPGLAPWPKASIAVAMTGLIIARARQSLLRTPQ